VFGPLCGTACICSFFLPPPPPHVKIGHSLGAPFRRNLHLDRTVQRAAPRDLRALRGREQGRAGRHQCARRVLLQARLIRGRRGLPARVVAAGRRGAALPPEPHRRVPRHAHGDRGAPRRTRGRCDRLRCDQVLAGGLAVCALGRYEGLLRRAAPGALSPLSFFCPTWSLLSG
jgi:hypothetical protein